MNNNRINVFIDIEILLKDFMFGVSAVTMNNINLFIIKTNSKDKNKKILEFLSYNATKENTHASKFILEIKSVNLWPENDMYFVFSKESTNVLNSKSKKDTIISIKFYEEIDNNPSLSNKQNIFKCFISYYIGKFKHEHNITSYEININSIEDIPDYFTPSKIQSDDENKFSKIKFKFSSIEFFELLTTCIDILKNSMTSSQCKNSKNNFIEDDENNDIQDQTNINDNILQIDGISIHTAENSEICFVFKNNFKEKIIDSISIFIKTESNENLINLYQHEKKISSNKNILDISDNYFNNEILQNEFIIIPINAIYMKIFFSILKKFKKLLYKLELQFIFPMNNDKITNIIMKYCSNSFDLNDDLEKPKTSKKNNTDLLLKNYGYFEYLLVFGKNYKDMQKIDSLFNKSNLNSISLFNILNPNTKQKNSICSDKQKSIKEQIELISKKYNKKIECEETSENIQKNSDLKKQSNLQKTSVKEPQVNLTNYFSKTTQNKQNSKITKKLEKKDTDTNTKSNKISYSQNNKSKSDINQIKKPLLLLNKKTNTNIFHKNPFDSSNMKPIKTIVKNKKTF